NELDGFGGDACRQLVHRGLPGGAPPFRSHRLKGACDGDPEALQAIAELEDHPAFFAVDALAHLRPAARVRRHHLHKTRDRPLEVDVVLPQRIVGVYQQHLSLPLHASDPASNASIPASSSTGTPSCCAFWSLPPGSAPATRYAVWALTDPLTLPPAARIRSFIWSRVWRSRVPVSTNVLPASTCAVFGSRGSWRGSMPAARNRATS